MTKRVLVAHGSNNGATEGIAETVARVLRQEGLLAEARPARAVTSLNPYDAVVVGGALYTGRWHRDTRRFVRRYREDLAVRPVWFFSSGPLDDTASRRDIPPVPGVGKAMRRLDVREHVTFGGRLTEGAEGWMARMLLRDGKGGDFRDVAATESWAARIAGELKRTPHG
jgi:menaquinone-dependent protoporphyrinogen oxidase